MKTQTAEIAIEQSGILSEGQFGISKGNEAWILGILRNQLYANKILAGIREYSTNGHDANVQNNKPTTPLTVKAPTMLNPIFSVRDYGPGLSTEDIYEIYSQYGASTKRDSNDFTGQLGIGSKSAFAYTDNFTIISWYGGEKCTYSAYIDETRLGKVSLLRRERTSEPTGIEIQYTVRTPDIQSFIKEIQTFYSTFHPQPQINIAIPAFPSHSYSYDNWKLLSSLQSHEAHRKFLNPTARMGNICYPIALEYLTDVTSDIEELLKLPLFIDFEIGELSIAASREALEYTKDTRLAIYTKLKQIKKDLSAEYMKTFDKTKDLWSAIQELSSNKHKNSSMDARFASYVDVLLAEALRKHYDKELPKFTSIFSLTSKEMYVSLPDSFAGKLKKTSAELVNQWSSYYSWGKTAPANYVWKEVLDANSAKTGKVLYERLPFYCAIIVNNSADAINRRTYTASKDLEQKYGQLSYVIWRAESRVQEGEKKRLTELQDLKDLNSLTALFPKGTPVVYLSDYSPASIEEELKDTSSTVRTAPVQTGPSAYAKAKVTLYSNHNWKPTEIDEDPNKEYVATIVSRKQPFLRDGTDLKSSLLYINSLLKLDPTIEIYGIKNANWDSINKKIKIITVEEKLKSLVEEKLDNLTNDEKEYLWLKTKVITLPSYNKYFFWLQSVNQLFDASQKQITDTHFDTLDKKITNPVLNKEITKVRTGLDIIDEFIKKINIQSGKTLDNIISIISQNALTVDSKYYIQYNDILDLIDELDNNPMFHWIFLSCIPGTVTCINKNISFSNREIIIDISNKL